MNKKLKIFILLVGFLGICLLSFLSYQIGVWVGEENILRTPPSQITEPYLEDASQKIDFSIFWEAWRKIERNFLAKEKIDYQKMVYGAIRGMIASLEDPHTTFFSPSETEDFEEELSGRYQGIGMEIAIREKKLTVISPLEGTPAQKAGLQPGDRILAINNTSTEKISIEEATQLIRGPEGTEVSLLISRKIWKEPKKITLKRTFIKIPTLKLEFKEIQNKPLIVYLKIYQFNRILDSEFQKASWKILNSQADRIILDLRFNPGGILDVAQNISGWFLKKGEIVAWQDFGKDKPRKVYKAKGSSKFSNYPMVILINQGSASGAEILAGALRDNRGVKLIGEKSFGKGSVQEPVFLQDGSSLKITIAKWLTPNGDSIDEKGLIPDIEVEMTEQDWEEGRDPQLEKAIEIIKAL